ncbi:MAG: sulfatase [Rikenellaceae bacterium]
MKPLFIIPTIALCGASCMSYGAENTTSRPNVILIVIDDLGWNDLSCMGSRYYETPAVDRLAREGVRFTDGYAGCSVSSPSRGSLVTGRATTRHGITSWIGDFEGDLWREKGHTDMLLPANYNHQLRQDEYTIANAFSDNGYSTYFIGKWHLGEELYPTDFGFDVNVAGWAAGGPRGGYFAPYENPMLEDGPDGENLSYRLGQEAIKLIDRSEDPFFMMLSFYAVHGAIQTTQERWDYYRQKALDQGVSEEGFDHEGRRLPTRIAQDNPVYAGLVEQMDSAIGDVIDHLEDAGGLDNTIIVFTSDNGGVVSGDSYSTSLRPIRGGKGTQWEGGIRVPFIVRNPLIESTQKIVNEPVIGMDIFPSMLDMCGLEQHPSAHLDGVSIKPLLEGESMEERALFWHFPHYGNQGGEPCSTVREGDWKLIYYHEDQRMELYNLANDISETTDLAASNSSKVNELRTKLDDFLSETNAIMPQPDPTYTEEAGAQWRAERFEKMKNNNEKLRKAQYRADWQPNADWWGSRTID